MSGFFTEYWGAKHLLFMMSDFVEVVLVAALLTTLFFGGWQIPYLGREGFHFPWGTTIALPSLVVAVLQVVSFSLKLVFFTWLQIVIRWTLPRFRYDQLMRLGWKGLLPASRERRGVGCAGAPQREPRVIIPLFLLMAALTVASALIVIVHPNPIYSALGLVSTLFMLAVLFLGLDAQMVAVLQIIVYAGAIVVLFLFVIMLLNLQVEERSSAAPPMVGIAAGRARDGRPVTRHRAPPLGRCRCTPASAPRARRAPVHGLPAAVRAPSLLLLVAIVGAVVVGRKRAQRGHDADFCTWPSAPSCSPSGRSVCSRAAT